MTLLLGKPLVRKGQSSTYFAYIQVIITEKNDVENHYHKVN